MRGSDITYSGKVGFDVLSNEYKMTDYQFSRPYISPQLDKQLDDRQRTALLSPEGLDCSKEKEHPILGKNGKAQQRLCDFAGLVGGDFQKMKRLGVLLRHEALDEGRDCGAVAKFVERRFVGRERLRRRNLVLVTALFEVGDGLHGAVLLVVEQERFLVLRIGLFGGLNRFLILIFFGHNTKCFK